MSNCHDELPVLVVKCQRVPTQPKGKLPPARWSPQVLSQVGPTPPVTRCSIWKCTYSLLVVDTGYCVVCVVANHTRHDSLQGSGQRGWLTDKEGCPYRHSQWARQRC